MMKETFKDRLIHRLGGITQKDFDEHKRRDKIATGMVAKIERVDIIELCGKASVMEDHLPMETLRAMAKAKLLSQIEPHISIEFDSTKGTCTAKILIIPKRA